MGRRFSGRGWTGRHDGLFPPVALVVIVGQPLRGCGQLINISGKSEKPEGLYYITSSETGGYTSTRPTNNPERVEPLPGRLGPLRRLGAHEGSYRRHNIYASRKHEIFAIQRLPNSRDYIVCVQRPVQPSYQTFPSLRSLRILCATLREKN